MDPNRVWVTEGRRIRSLYFSTPEDADRFRKFVRAHKLKCPAVDFTPYFLLDNNRVKLLVDPDPDLNFPGVTNGYAANVSRTTIHAMAMGLWRSQKRLEGQLTERELQQFAVEVELKIAKSKGLEQFSVSGLDLEPPVPITRSSEATQSFPLTIAGFDGKIEVLGCQEGKLYLRVGLPLKVVVFG
jgi:hypothetical protein